MIILILILILILYRFPSPFAGGYVPEIYYLPGVPGIVTFIDKNIEPLIF
jgi:hypothetical protein